MFANSFPKLLLQIGFLHKPAILRGDIKSADILTEMQSVTIEPFLAMRAGIEVSRVTCLEEAQDAITRR